MTVSREDKLSSDRGTIRKAEGEETLQTAISGWQEDSLDRGQHGVTVS